MALPATTPLPWPRGPCTCPRIAQSAPHRSRRAVPHRTHTLQMSIFFGNSMFAIVNVLQFGMPVSEAVGKAALLTLVQSAIELCVHVLAIAGESRMGIPVIEAWRARYKYQILVVMTNGVLATLYVRSWVSWVVTSAVQSAADSSGTIV